MTIIYLVRHGQASFGAENYDQLSENGEQQSKILGKHFHEILDEAPYIVAGSMQRHQQTASFALAEAFANAPIQINSNWNEFNHQQVFSQYDARFKQPHLLKHDIAKDIHPRAFLSKIFTGAMQRWTAGEHHHEYDESWPQFKNRIEVAFQTLCYELTKMQPRYAVVFTSAGVISVIAGKLLQLNPDQTCALSWEIANTSLTTLQLCANEPTLLSVNQYPFIQEQHPELLTWI